LHRKSLLNNGTEKSGTKMLHVGVEVLRAGVMGPCLHRPENWLVRQLNDEPKLVHEAGFIREKEKATARKE
jgi:hypothetical protein